ncbi:hypothetical protein [Mesorhizobium liriopis]|nr:hypothetical protein [Mesorhizobium liriopis]
MIEEQVSVALTDPRRVRAAAQLTREQVAERAGVSQQDISGL